MTPFCIGGGKCCAVMNVTFSRNQLGNCQKCYCTLGAWSHLTATAPRWPHFALQCKLGQKSHFFAVMQDFFGGIMIDDLSLDLGMKKAWHLFIYAFCAIGGHFLWCYSPSWWAQSMNLFINHHFQDFFCRRHLEHFRQLVNWSSLIRQNDQLRSWSILPLSLFIIFVSSPQIVFSYT